MSDVSGSYTQDMAAGLGLEWKSRQKITAIAMLVTKQKNFHLTLPPLYYSSSKSMK